MNLGKWKVRSWKLPARLTALLLAVIGGLVGSLSEYDGIFPALGGANGLLFDLTLKTSQPWRRNVPTVPALFVALDDASLSRPELAALPRALFQPIWARLIDGLLDSGARQIAFDLVLAFAATDFRVGSFMLPEYDRSLIESLARGRGRIVLGRFPSVAPAAPFVEATRPARVGVLDLQVESDGRVRSTAALARLADGRIAFGFDALAAGLSIRQASSAQRVLITPHAPPTETPTYSLATLLDCLVSPDGAGRVRQAVEGRIVVVGTAVLGEDEHRGPTRFLGRASRPPSGDSCAPQSGLIQRAQSETMPGALLHIAAIQSAANNRSVALAPKWLRVITGASLALLFALAAFQDESALIFGEHDISSRSVVLIQLVRSMVTGLAGPVFLGCIATAACFILADLWLPMGYSILATSLGFATIVGVRSARHRALFKRLYQTAGRYLPPARLATLARCGFASTPEGEEREVSIVLADLVGFTSFSNEPDRTASEVVQVANRYFTLMQAAIDRHQGCSDKFLGDAVLAFWNGLSDEPDHALKALAAARDIIDAMKDAEGTGKSRLAARAVVCSGRVYVGDLGAEQRRNFTIIGPAVNETFRLEKFPDIYGLPLLVSASTTEIIKKSQKVSTELLGGVLVRIDDVELKGFAQPLSVYALVPGDDPGLAEFAAGRKALDQQMREEGLAHLDSVDAGMLRQAAKIVGARYRALQ